MVVIAKDGKKTIYIAVRDTEQAPPPPPPPPPRKSLYREIQEGYERYIGS